MKNIFKIFAVSLALVAGSCNFIDPELNVDPNNPLDVSMNLLLPQTETSIAYVLGGDLNRYTSMWTQHHSGVERQSASYEVYQVKENDVNNAWGNIYAGALQDLKIIMAKATETESPHYRGVARVLTAFMVGNVVDLWNDIPYSDALKGAEQLKPTYDSGSSVYDQIQAMLRDAKVDLGTAASSFTPGSDDLVYGGDLDKWIALANTLLARNYLHVGDYSSALNAINDGAIADNGGNAMVDFGNGPTEQNPWYQFEDQRGDVVMGKFFIDLLVSINDPRLPYFATKDQAGGYSGAAAGVPNTTVSRFGPYYGSADSPVPFATYAETKFIEAEAAFPTNKSAAADAYNAGIAASLDQLGIDDAAFLAQEAADQNSITLEKIMTHKYIACYTTLETFTDWRRTGIPALQPAAGTTQIARRFPYPGDERLYNNANWSPYSSVTVFDKVFWDN
ncbi:MAG: SusD/RagB family nutrient-binding outer membrane lipoprotein [Lewinellaceae bacterium]|nr:SusD/RagB family nutrient-binding outer membrane lipoprotein [Lewinellaceae bacterium]